MQQENLSVVLGNLGQSPPDFVSPFVLESRRRCVGRGNTIHGPLVVDVRHRVATHDLVRRSTAVPKDVKQPRFEAMTLLVAWQRTVQANERFLHHVFGIVGVMEHATCKPKTSRIVRFHDGRERVDVAELGSANRRRIYGGGLSGTLQSDCSRREGLDIVFWQPN
jgi:hypothetical protein